jgi:alpha-galactosidase
MPGRSLLEMMEQEMTSSQSWKSEMRCRILLLLFVVLVAHSARAATTIPPAIVSTTDVTLALRDAEHAPTLAWVSGIAGLHFSNAAAEPLPASVEVNSAQVPLTWKLKPELGHADKHQVVFVYESVNPHLRLSWEWQARADFGPIEHRITVENLSGQEIWLPLIDSLRLELQCAPQRKLQYLYVEKGADTPSPVGTHIGDIPEGYQWTGKSSTYAFPQKGEAREVIPAEFVFNADQLQAGWFTGIEFSGRTRVSLARSGNTVTTVLGLNPEPGPFRTRLEAGEKFETPTVFLGAFAGGPDGAANQLRPWVRAVLGNPATWKDPQYPLTVNNSWGGGMKVDEQVALRMMADAKELGLEMFHVDAGWFRGVGDWYPNPQKFPHGLAFIADAAHRQGLRFGLWVDWTQAALDTETGALNARDPNVRDWLVTDLAPEWKPEEFKGQTVDLGVPAAHDYLAKEVDRIVSDYHLDMLEHDGYLVAQGCVRDDHPHAPPNRSTMKIVHDWGSDFVVASNSTDVSYHAVRAYYDIYAKTRRAHPGLIFEICDDGGRMVDFGSAAHGDYFSITDTYDPLSNRRAFYDTSYMLPPAMLESYVEKWPTPRLENFLYMLRSGMMGWVTIMIDTSTWTEEQHEAAKQAIALYKQKLRPLIRDARLYHVSQRPDGVHWDGIEYWDPAQKQGALYAFRGSIENDESHAFLLQGLNPAMSYSLHFQDGSSQDAVFRGNVLMKDGVVVHLLDPLSSEVVFLEEAGGSHSPH